MCTRLRVLYYHLSETTKATQEEQKINNNGSGVAARMNERFNIMNIIVTQMRACKHCYEHLFQDYANVRRGMRNCIWMQSEHNLCEAREDEELQLKKEKARLTMNKKR